MKYTRSSTSGGRSDKMGNEVPSHSKAHEDSHFDSRTKEINTKPLSMSKSNKVSKWNYEDEYKSYLENSMKRKLRSSDLPEPQKLRKIHQEKLTLLPQSLVHNISTDKFQTVPTHLKAGPSGNFNGVLMNGRVALEKLPASVFKRDHKSINNKNSKLRNSTINTTYRKDLKSNTKLTSLQMLELQLRNQPMVILDKTVVKNYVTAKRIIEKILRTDKTPMKNISRR